MDFIPHLEELRKRLVFCLIVLGVTAAASYFFSHQILDLLTWPLRQYSNEPLIFQKPYEAFVIHIKAAAFTGLIISSPILLTQLWGFVAPGLYEKEKKVFVPVVLISIVLFLVGIVFSFFLIIPWGLHFMLEFQTPNLKPLLSASSYFSFLMGMLLAFGILFDFPVLIVGLVEMGVIQTSWLKECRRAFIVIIFIAAAVLTPSPDPISQLLLALPLCALFEISILIGAKREKKRESL